MTLARSNELEMALSSTMDKTAKDIKATTAETDALLRDMTARRQTLLETVSDLEYERDRVCDKLQDARRALTAVTSALRTLDKPASTHADMEQLFPSLTEGEAEEKPVVFQDAAILKDNVDQ